MSLARVIADQGTSHDVPHAVACRALEVSQSWFYKWASRQPTPTERRRAELDVVVAAAFKNSRRLHGSPRLPVDLRDAGWRVSEKNGGGLDGPPRIGYAPDETSQDRTRPDKRTVPFPDLVQRAFSAPAPNAQWMVKGVLGCGVAAGCWRVVVADIGTGEGVAGRGGGWVGWPEAACGVRGAIGERG